MRTLRQIVSRELPVQLFFARRLWIHLGTMVPLVIAGLLTACTSSSGPVVRRTFTAMIATGQVVAPSGQPVTGATIKLTPLWLNIGGTDRIGDCEGKPLSANYTVRTDAGGRFTVRLEGGPGEGPVCMAAQVTPPANSNLSPVTATTGPVVFRGPGAGVVLDSAKFLVTLRAQS